jgi:putative FmdB family regulatory protein
MPIYEYRCEKCGNEFEEYMSINDSNPDCPECGKTTQKLISRFLGVIKGSENRSIDCLVGEDADKRRGYLEKRKQNRKLKIGGSKSCSG